MADRRNRGRRGILLLGVGGLAGAVAWVVRWRSGAGRPVRDEWARAVEAPPAAARVRTPEPVPVGTRHGGNGSAPVNGSAGTNGAGTNGRAPLGLLATSETPVVEKPPAGKPAARKPSPAKPVTQKPAAEKPVPDGPYGPGSAAPLPDGSAPGPEFTIKGNAKSMLFHPPSSPYFGRTKPEAWFRTAEDAERAGFTEWKPKPRGT
jgi:hypothetical protein